MSQLRYRRPALVYLDNLRLKDPSRADDYPPQITFTNSGDVQQQIGVQQVQGSVYYGSVYYHSRTSHLSPSTPRNHQVLGKLNKTTASTDDLLPEDLLDQTHELRESRFEHLYFEQLEVRQASIEKAHAKTCDWFLEQPEYVSWIDLSSLNDHQSLLWIKGKPGSGKSTLMKYLLTTTSKSLARANETASKDRHPIIAAFFFNARGSELERSPIGNYRSLLHQILQQEPNLLSALDTMSVMTIPTLQETFEDIATKLAHRPLIIFVDALDECEEGDIQDLVNFFEDLLSLASGSGCHVRICLSSRHYPYITTRYSVSLTIEDQSQHGNDMMQYVQSKLVIGSGPNADELRQKILYKASGVFLWVKLVVKMLNGKYRSGRSFEMKKFLERLPNDLEELYERVLDREEDDDDDPDARKEMLLCFQWVSFAIRPLSIVELYFAVLSNTAQIATADRKGHDVSRAEMERYVLNCSKGLVVETRGYPRTMQFIHETLRTYLIQGNGMVQLGLRPQDSGASHADLAQRCMEYIQLSDNYLRREFGLDYVRRKRKNWSNYVHKFRSPVEELPFLSYATEYLLHHSDIAQGSEVPQEALLSELDHDLWQWLKSAILGRSYCVNEFCVPLPAGLAVMDLPHLMQLYLQSVQTIDVHYGGEQSLLALASKWRCEKVLRVLLAPASKGVLTALDNCPASPDESQLLERTVNFLMKVSSTVKWNCRSLTAAAFFGNISMVRCLLNTGKVAINEREPDGSNALSVAISRGFPLGSLATEPSLRFGIASTPDKYRETALAFISAGADLSSLTYAQFEAVLCHAAWVGDLTAIERILGSITWPFHRYHQAVFNAIHDAANAGHTDILQLLVKSVADTQSWKNEIDLVFELVLRSSRNNHYEVCKLLLVGGAQVNLIYGDGSFPLLIAAKKLDLKLARLLLSYGANPEMKSPFTGRTAQREAALADLRVAQTKLQTTFSLAVVFSS